MKTRATKPRDPRRRVARDDERPDDADDRRDDERTPPTKRDQRRARSA